MLVLTLTFTVLLKQKLNELSAKERDGAASANKNCDVQVEVAGVVDRHRRVGDQPELGGDATQGPAEAEAGQDPWSGVGLDQAWWQGAGVEQARGPSWIGKTRKIASV